jgi:hypothetical protein
MKSFAEAGIEMIKLSVDFLKNYSPFIRYREQKRYRINLVQAVQHLHEPYYP